MSLICLVASLLTPPSRFTHTVVHRRVDGWTSSAQKVRSDYLFLPLFFPLLFFVNILLYIHSTVHTQYCTGILLDHLQSWASAVLGWTGIPPSPSELSLSCTGIYWDPSQSSHSAELQNTLMSRLPRPPNKNWGVYCWTCHPPMVSSPSPAPPHPPHSPRLLVKKSLIS